MRISSASFLIDGCKKWNSLFWSLQFRIWEWILTRVYRLFPTQIGTIDEDLESDIRDGLLYAGVRFRTFNNSFGSFVFYGAFLLLLMFLIGVPAILLPPSSPEIFQIVGTLVLGIAGVLLVLSMILIGFADLLLLLYIASLLRFVLQKIQPSVSHPEDTSPSVYISKRIDLTDGSETSIKVYKSNLESVFRFSVFLLLCLILPVLHFFSELLVRPAKNLLNIAAMQKISELSYIPEIDGLLESLDALLPIELKVLVSPESAPFLKLLIFSLLLFSAFINWKKVYQHAVQSQFKWTDYEKFSWWAEFKDCVVVAKIVMYHFLYGGLSEEFKIIRGQIAYLPIVLILGVILTYFHLLIISGTV